MSIFAMRLRASRSVLCSAYLSGRPSPVLILIATPPPVQPLSLRDRLMQPLIRFCLAVAFCAAMITPAAAQKIDMSTLGCADALNAKSKDGTGPDKTMLYWLAGYHTTADQGTIVDNKQLTEAVDKSLEYCKGHLNIGVMSATAKYMGEKLGEPGADAIDVATVTCSKFVADKKSVDTYMDTIFFLHGFHVSSSKDSTILDFTKLAENVGSLVEYCVKNPQVGLVTATEKFMVEE